MRRKLTVGLFIMSGLVTGWTARCPAAPQTLDAGRRDALRQTLEALRIKYEIPGMAVALVTADSVLFCEGFGVASAATGEPVTGQTLFRVASITKTFTALGILRLVERGQLDLDAKVRDLVPEIEMDNPWEATDPVRLVHLLEHTSGLDTDHFNEVYHLGDGPALSLREVLAKNPGSRRVRWRPGTHFAYSNDGFALAGYILEKAVGRPYDAVICDSVLSPLGMSEATFHTTENGTAQGHIHGQPSPMLDYNLRPATALYASASEMTNLVRMFLNRGRIGEAPWIHPETVDRMERPTSGRVARAGYPYGYGIGLRAGLVRSRIYFGHGGGLPDYSAQYGFIPELGIGCVVLLNTVSDGLGPLFATVMGSLMDAPAPTPEPAVALNRADLAQFVGYYQHCNSERRLDAMLNVLLAGCRIGMDGDSLTVGYLGSAPQTLIPVGPATFRTKKQPVGTYVFLKTGSDRWMLAEPLSRVEYIRTGSWKPAVYRGSLILCLLLLVSIPLHALFWIPARLIRRKTRPSLWTRLLPLGAVLSLGGALWALSLAYRTVWTLGEANPATISFFGGTVLFALFSLMSLWGLIKGWKRVGGVLARIHATLIVLACVGMTAYLASWGLIGLRLWAY